LARKPPPSEPHRNTRHWIYTTLPANQPPDHDLHISNDPKYTPERSLFNMSGSAQGSTATTKAVVDDKNKNGDVEKDKKPAAPLEEDDEFEDFPKEGVCTWQRDTKEVMRWM
jgi:hypothetical protein